MNVNVDVRFGPSDKTKPVRYRGHLTVMGFFDVHPDFAEDSPHSHPPHSISIPRVRRIR